MIDFFIVPLLSTIILYIACTNLLPISLKMKEKFIIFLYAFVIITILCPYIGQAATPIAIIGILILISFIGSRKMLNLCCALFGYALTIVINYITVMFLEHNYNISMSNLNNELIIPFSVFFAFITYIITSALKWLLWKRAKLQEIKLSKQVLFFISLNLVVCVMIFVFNFIFGEKLNYPSNVVFFNGVLFTTYFVFSILLLFLVIQSVSKEENMKSMLSQYQNLQDYTNKIEKLYMEMRTFKHDYINILSTLSCYMENQDMNGLKEYFSDEIMPLNASFDQTNTKLGLLSNIKILEIKSLLYSKMIYAMTNNIDVYLDIAEPIETISMKIVDLTRVIGIFLDNAIEATLETNEKKLEIGIIKKDDSILIIVKNSCLAEKVHLNKIYDSGYSTKGTNRGIGLYSAKQVLGHYENIIHSTCIKDIHFTQQIEIIN